MTASSAFLNVRKMRTMRIPDRSIGGTAAFAAALNSLTSAGGQILIPPGDIIIDPSAFSERDNVELVGHGAGEGGSRILLASAGTMLTFSDSQWFKARGITFQLNGTSQAIAGTYGVRMDSGSGNAIFDSCHFRGFAQDGLQLVGTSGTPLSGHTIDKCYFLGNGVRQLYGDYCNDYQFLNSQIGRLTGIARATYGAYLNQCSAGTYSNMKHWENGIGCANVSGNFSRIIGSRFEENQTNGYFQNGGSYTKFIGCDLYANSAASSGTHDGAYFVNADDLTIDGCQAPIFNSTRHRNDINVDAGCDRLNWGDNLLANFNTSFGPLRVDGTSVGTFYGDNSFSWATNGTVAPGAWFIGVNGQKAVEADTYALAGRRAVVVRMYCAATAAPVGAQTFTYTLYVNGSATGMQVVITGAATAGEAAVTTPAILVAPTDVLSVRLDVSGTATTTQHRVLLVPAEY